MPEKGWKTITIREEVLDQIQNYMQEEAEALEALGIKNIGELVSTAVSEYTKKKPPKPRLQHFNVNEDHITVIDNELGGRLIDVYIRERRLWCDSCRRDDCIHVGYAWSIDDVKRTLRR
ncbi:MAG: hypothetical protein HYU39_04580 [Thaumarchaeota archaeon]|nr:hypothetical protein [Nitrososphaerota archaeon]